LWVAFLSFLWAELVHKHNAMSAAQSLTWFLDKRLKRCTDSTAQMDIEDKLAEALEKQSREGTVLEQIRQEAKNKAQELHITLTLEQLRTDV
jgi:dsRNA-specific ribonuclease